MMLMPNLSPEIFSLSWHLLTNGTKKSHKIVYQLTIVHDLKATGAY
jgi:hypothetical protein